MDSYGFLAACYDSLTTDVEYGRWADYLEKHFAKNPLPIHSVVDLGCGTGSLTFQLALRGYAVTGVDLSEDMLAVAADKCDLPDPRPLFVHQDMSRLSLPTPADAVVCCLDSLNYVTSPKAVQRTFRKVYDALRPGGLFVFDIRTPSFLRAMDGQTWLDENDEVYCVWRGEFSQKRNILSYYMDLFARNEDGLWKRGWELHEEYAYEPAQMAGWLADAGFTAVKQYGNLKLRAPKEGEERIFFTAHKGEH